MRIAVITIDHRQPTAIIQKLFDVADLTSQDRRYIVAETLADTELIRHSSEDRRCLSIHSLIGTSSLKHFLVIVASFSRGSYFSRTAFFFRDDLLFKNGVFIKIFSIADVNGHRFKNSSIISILPFKWEYLGNHVSVLGWSYELTAI